jgi:hypothetical protein
VLYYVGDGGLAGARQAGEPQGETPLFLHTGGSFLRNCL